MKRLSRIAYYLTRKMTIIARTGILLIVTFSMVFALFVPNPVIAGNDKKSTAPANNSGRISHLLNRITFGPRPGDIERVKQIGIDKYIDQQLHPERINDSDLQTRLSALPSLHMDAADLYDKYPQPMLIARQLGIVGGAGKRKQVNTQAQPQSSSGDQADDNGSGTSMDQNKNQAAAGGALNDLQSPQNRELIRNYYQQHDLRPPQLLLAELQAGTIISAVYSQRQLQEVLTDFWFNHFNIFWQKGADRWYTTEYVNDVIRPHSLGKFEDLLMATAKSPAMLFYLDNYQSSSPDAQPPQMMRRLAAIRRARFGGFGQVNPGQPGQDQAAKNAARRKPGINENYGRELMELHTLGVDGGYTQKDVQEVARCFTGWTIEAPRRGGHFVFRAWMHDNGQKVVLGHVIPAGGGERDGEMVIDILAHHPSTAKFISTELCRKFVSDNPPQSLVDKVSQVYMKSDGDIRQMMRTILASSEFNSPEAIRAKIKSPFELAVSAIRSLGGDTDGSPQLGQWIAKMGQPLFRYQAPTGYPDRASEWVNTGALLDRLNFAIALTSNKIKGTTVQINSAAAGGNSDQLVKSAVDQVLDGNVSKQTLAVLNKQMSQEIPAADEAAYQRQRKQEEDSMDGDMMMQPQQQRVRGERAGNRAGYAGANWPLASTVPPSRPVDPEVAKAFGLVLGSPEFQRR